MRRGTCFSLDIAGSVHCGKVKSCTAAAWPLLILEILTSIRRWRVAGFAVALTQRPHSPMANAGSLTIRFRSDRSIGAADEAISV